MRYAIWTQTFPKASCADLWTPAVLIFPFSILKSLRFTQLRDKLNLAVIFTLGIITVIVSTVRFMYMIFLTNDISLGQYAPLTCLEARFG